MRAQYLTKALVYATLWAISIAAIIYGALHANTSGEEPQRLPIIIVLLSSLLQGIMIARVVSGMFVDFTGFTFFMSWNSLIIFWIICGGLSIVLTPIAVIYNVFKYATTPSSSVRATE